jgi:hypothetical protein
VWVACSLHVEENYWQGGPACGEAEADRWRHVKKILRIVLNPDFDYWYRK